MKKISLVILLLFAVLSLLIVNCSKKLYDHVNPLDPAYNDGSDGSDGGDDDGDSGSDKYIKFNTSANIIQGTNTAVEIEVYDETISSPSVNIQIKSLEDTTGISLQLNKTSDFTYKKNLLFSRYNSAGNRIKIHDMDLVTITYGLKSDKIVWESSAQKYWYRTQFHDQDFKYDQNNPPTDHGGVVGYWGGINTSASGDDYSDTAPVTSSASWKIVVNGSAGGGYLLYGTTNYVATTEDLSAYASGHVCFYIKATFDLKIALDDPDGADGNETGTTLSAQGVPLDGQWHFVSIPMNVFTGIGGINDCNLTQLKSIGFHRTSAATGNYWVDQIYFVQE